MKKIISAFALASLALGVATADVKFALNYRTQMVGFSRLISASNTNADENNNYWFQQPKGYQSASDTVSVTASNDIAGVTVRIDPTLDNDSKPSFQLNQYNAYIKLGSFEIGAGNWKDGRYNGTYQVKNDSDAGWYNGDVFGLVKLGSLYANAITLAVDDMANFGGGDKSSSAYLQWKGNLGNANITAEGALIGINNDTWDEESTIFTGFGARLNTSFESWQAQFVFKSASNKVTTTGKGEQRALALHINPKGLPWTVVFGGSLGFNNGNVTELNADFRARKAFGGTSITFYTNISHITNDCDYITGNKGNLGAEYLQASDGKVTAITNTWKADSSQNYNTHMWNMLGLRSKVNDRFYLLLTTGAITSLRNMTTDRWTGAEAFVAPGFQIMNGKSGIATYARFGFSNIGVKDHRKGEAEEGPEMSVMIPVVIRVRF